MLCCCTAGLITWFIARDIHTAAAVSRNFFWTDVNLWPDEIPSSSLFVLSEQVSQTNCDADSLYKGCHSCMGACWGPLNLPCLQCCVERPDAEAKTDCHAGEPLGYYLAMLRRNHGMS